MIKELHSTRLGREVHRRIVEGKTEVEAGINSRIGNIIIFFRVLMLNQIISGNAGLVGTIFINYDWFIFACLSERRVQPSVLCFY